MPGFPTPTNVVGVNANRWDPHKSRESPALHDQTRDSRPWSGARIEGVRAA